MQLKKNSNKNVAKQSPNSKMQKLSNIPNDDNDTVNTKLNEDSFDDDFPSDSDSDPIFSINGIYYISYLSQVINYSIHSIINT